MKEQDNPVFWGTPEKQVEVFRAWKLEGKEIEYWCLGKWNDAKGDNWNNLTYRIKPKPRVAREGWVRKADFILPPMANGAPHTGDFIHVREVLGD